VRWAGDRQVRFGSKSEFAYFERGNVRQSSASKAEPMPTRMRFTGIPLGGGADVSHFTYDLYFCIDNGPASQALEFDVNHTFGGTRGLGARRMQFQRRRPLGYLG
jgi:hypothetical protein